MKTAEQLCKLAKTFQVIAEHHRSLGLYREAREAERKAHHMANLAEARLEQERCEFWIRYLSNLPEDTDATEVFPLPEQGRKAS